MDAPRRLLQRAFLDTDARRREVHAPSHRPPQRRTDTVPALIVPLARWRTFWSHALRCSLENHKPLDDTLLISTLGAPPNETRLSCGALKKDSFPNLRAVSFKRVLGGAPRFGLRDRLRHQFAEAGFESAGPNERSGIETLLADVEPEPSRHGILPQGQ